ncbi:MAG: bifunctional phosphopantothenoylcysteine decarboxylase/phosphopantothenate--cysteine ligase CoaBC [Ilumatobacter sp.]|jgi:phosphopantothenoylcysteine decarboxylase / phosphopantothenate---cysteine ligase|uniref:bifunctional phosphopantothenoylcysteine decarboxylase/phosphopantothenate--cysteine ligase CoaBC n=1 Tax=Ilumatobacter sp. TaxID=1967498 RepID=UPI001DD60BBA|nr:bifunctional phosphopantothenoylcysteine decarboxylase/phosphopantothenate--cysteine ligase CoaBC [Ilumatobacter sp.]MBT5275065.1 bifunctional phosphopantothenoylcysteine decarboxylase/phosphopantothenate--cysteine ligase CoaBC [Ilumatobacter sp.]MBT5553021.1 bifunctional phosphopantothenoylcysteine decarboxylase/phosphopantothenate--cysteine ligase CoaBC [Ilumatobacter sp.]MBT5864089.1 bifunctional phosphopantothenoylcysteine decarboxylase/phosphopantothenate--cysteine ligase CoaBC [Ilumatob
MSASPLTGKRIVLGVTGGIAAYKAIELSRRLVDAGAHVVPIMTDAAQHFVGATTLGALASEPVQTELWNNPTTPIPHTKVGQGADLIIVAPATAKSIAAYRMGYSHDLLQNTLIATRAPVIVCPAMHTEMWEHPSVVDNIATLRKRGVHIVEPESGRLAGGDMGAGRLADPATILGAAERILGPADLTGVRVVVSAGGTREPIDAVRVIANRSSGKQGYAVAAEAAARGAQVTLVSTVGLPTPAGVQVIAVETAAEMQEAMERAAIDHDVIVMAAAVADFRPAHAASGKIKKRDGVPEIVLQPTPDILAGLGANKRDDHVLVGFAAETANLVDNAQGKLERKRLDLIVANDVSAPGVGFAHDTNAVTLLRPGAKPVEIDLATKRDVARAVIDAVVDIRNAR